MNHTGSVEFLDPILDAVRQMSLFSVRFHSGDYHVCASSRIHSD